MRNSSFVDIDFGFGSVFIVVSQIFFFILIARLLISDELMNSSEDFPMLLLWVS